MPFSLAHWSTAAAQTSLPGTSLNSKDWLAAAHRGAYTTARTVDQGRKVFKLTSHVERLATSANLMLGEPHQAAPHSPHTHGPFSPEHLRTPVVDAMSAAVLDLQRQQGACSTSDGSGQQGGEAKLTVLLTWADGGHEVDLWCHAQPLPARPQPPISIQIRGEPRSNARAKDSEWVRQRQALEQQKPADCEEVVLSMPGTGALLEGLSSNFLALVGGTLVTAEEGVLSGTVRDLVLQVCRDQGVPVQLRPPLLNELPGWQAAFISSTSRLLLPVDLVLYERGGQQLTHAFEKQDPLAKQLEQGVIDAVLAASEPLQLEPSLA